MLNRWWTAAVVLFWLATMGWLVVNKVLPPLRVGEPPSYRTIVEGRPNAETVVGWEMFLNDKPVGWAESRTRRGSDGVTDLDSLVHFTGLPEGELGAGWMKTVLKPLEEAARLTMDIESSVQIDPLGQLIGFQSSLKLGDVPSAIGLRGIAEADRLKLTVRSGEYVSEHNLYLPPNSMVGDALSPQDRLPNLRLGQTWTEPVYSPFNMPSQPMEILLASVEREDTLVWCDRAVRCLLVVYRRDTGSGLESGGPPSGRAWVRQDGTVLKQEVMLLGARVSFVRRVGETD